MTHNAAKMAMFAQGALAGYHMCSNVQGTPHSGMQTFLVFGDNRSKPPKKRQAPSKRHSAVAEVNLVIIMVMEELAIK